MSSFTKYLRLISRAVLIIISVLFFIFALISGADDYGGGLKGIVMNSPNALPWLVLLGLNYVVFKWELIGGILIVLLGLFTVFFFKALEHQFVLWVISLPLILLGGFLVISWFLDKKIKS